MGEAAGRLHARWESATIAAAQLWYASRYICDVLDHAYLKVPGGMAIQPGDAGLVVFARPIGGVEAILWGPNLLDGGYPAVTMSMYPLGRCDWPTCERLDTARIPQASAGDRRLAVAFWLATRARLVDVTDRQATWPLRLHAEQAGAPSVVHVATIGASATTERDGSGWGRFVTSCHWRQVRYGPGAAHRKITLVAAR
jgi:hypothetical protein